MEENESIDAMEKGQPSTDVVRFSILPGSQTTTPQRTPTKSDFSQNTGESLLTHPTEPKTTIAHQVLRYFKEAMGSKARSMAKLPVIIRPVHGPIKGYPTMASFLDSDDNFMVYRRFGYVQSRLLLAKQEKLRCLQEDLEDLDREQVDESGNQDLLRQSILGDALDKPRNKLMAEVEKVYLEYSQLLQTAQAMVAMNKPSSSEYTSVVNFMHNDAPLAKAEGGFIWHKEDLVTLRPGREYAWLDSFIEKVLRACHCKLIERVFCSYETRQKSTREEEVYYTRTRIDAAVNMIIMLMILVLLILPIYPLYRLTEGNQTLHTTAVCIGVLLVFTLIFSAVITLFTRARRHEILATSAAYCAVLVVFISNVSGQRSGGGIGGVN